MVRPVVLITSLLSDDIVAEVEQHASVIQGGSKDKGMPRDQVLAQVGDVAAILNQNELKIDAELLEKAPRLEVVANATAGFDNMNVAEMRRRQVWGTNCPESFAVDTANHAMGLLLSITRRLLEADRYVRSGAWKRDGWMPGGRWDGVSLTGKRMGIIGYGHIGKHVATRAKAFGMSVRHHTRSGAGDPEWQALRPLLEESDVISVHCPLNESTRHLIDRDALRIMKPTAILLNLARGPVVNIADLIDALEEGRLAGAGLDVFEFEPEVPEALIAMPNVVLTPHMAGCTVETRRSALRLCIENIVCVLTGRPPKTPVFQL